jgi:hypothetical protein
MRRNSTKLTTRHKMWLYAVTLVVYLTGAIWGWLHYIAIRPDEIASRSPLEPWMMRLHGAGTMALLVILGTLLPGHVRFGWHARRNRPARNLRLSRVERLRALLLCRRTSPLVDKLVASRGGTGVAGDIGSAHLDRSSKCAVSPTITRNAKQLSETGIRTSGEQKHSHGDEQSRPFR